MLGTNDTKICNWDREKYRRDMSALIDSYLELPSHPDVVILIPPPAVPFLGKVRWDIRSDVLEEVIPICRELVVEKGLRLIDVHEVFEDRESLFVDGIHPGAKGAELIAETIYAEMNMTR